MENRIDFVQIKDFTFNETPDELIVPGVIAREMVYHYPEHNSKEFKSAKALEKAAMLFKWAPLVVDHTQWPEIQVSEYEKIIGGVFVKGVENGKLKGDYHFNKTKSPRELLSSIRAGKVLGTSPAFVCNPGPRGSYNGEDYDLSQEDIMLKHVGVTLNLSPRCAIDQGCGVGLDAMTAINEDSAAPAGAFHPSKSDEIISKKSPSSKQKPKSDSPLPFAGYESFEDCVAKNQDKEDPEAYCAEIKRKTEDKQGDAVKMETKTEPEKTPEKTDATTDKVERLEAQLKEYKDALIEDICSATNQVTKEELQNVDCVDALRIIKRLAASARTKKTWPFPAGSSDTVKKKQKLDPNKYFVNKDLLDPIRHGVVKKDG